MTAVLTMSCISQNLRYHARNGNGILAAKIIQKIPGSRPFKALLPIEHLMDAR